MSWFRKTDPEGNRNQGSAISNVTAVTTPYNFDIIRYTTSQQLWDEQVAVYPELKATCELLEAECKCGKIDCQRKMLQAYIRYVPNDEILAQLFPVLALAPNPELCMYMLVKVKEAGETALIRKQQNTQPKRKRWRFL